MKFYNLIGPAVEDRQDFERVAPILAEMLRDLLIRDGLTTFSADYFEPHPLAVEWVRVIDGIRVTAQFSIQRLVYLTGADTAAV